MMDGRKFKSQWLLAVVGLLMAGALYIGISPGIASAHDPLPENCHTYQGTDTLNHSHNYSHIYHCEGIGHPNYQGTLASGSSASGAAPSSTSASGSAPGAASASGSAPNAQATSFEHVIGPVEKCMDITVGAEMFATVVSMATLMGATVAEDFGEGEHADSTEVRVCYSYVGSIVGRVWAEVR